MRVCAERLTLVRHTGQLGELVVINLLLQVLRASGSIYVKWPDSLRVQMSNDICMTISACQVWHLI